MEKCCIWVISNNFTNEQSSWCSGNSDFFNAKHVMNKYLLFTRGFKRLHFAHRLYLLLSYNPRTNSDFHLNLTLFVIDTMCFLWGSYRPFKYYLDISFIKWLRMANSVTVLVIFYTYWKKTILYLTCLHIIYIISLSHCVHPDNIFIRYGRLSYDVLVIFLNNFCADCLNRPRTPALITQSHNHISFHTTAKV
jgi:hypothetical protein